jgi:molecular chaperone Hsp33
MLRGLGQAEVQGIVEERGLVNVGCEFCGAQYRFDAVEARQLFAEQADQPPTSTGLQ